MTKEELTNAICPWSIFAAAIANKLTGKEYNFLNNETGNKDFDKQTYCHGFDKLD